MLNISLHRLAVSEKPTVLQLGVNREQLMCCNKVIYSCALRRRFFPGTADVSGDDAPRFAPDVFKVIFSDLRSAGGSCDGRLLPALPPVPGMALCTAPFSAAGVPCRERDPCREPADRTTESRLQTPLQGVSKTVHALLSDWRLLG